MNPNVIEFGFITIKWYAIIILFAIILGGVLAIKEAKKHQLSMEIMIDLFLGTIISAIVGARMYYVIFNWSYYSQNISEILQIWQGGLAIHGAIITGLLWVIYYTKKKKINTLQVTDIISVSLILGQAIGRWGNFMNGEAHGPITSLAFLNNIHLPNFIIEGMKIGNTYYQPTFLYESIWCIIGFIIIVLIRKISKIKIGQLTSIYLIWYGLGRIGIESLRTDSLMIADIKVAQLVSIIMTFSGIILFLICNKNKQYKGEKD
ncbi:MAG: prolipoprotein diacylglyceryl transferase [Bacilli bacterium]